MDKFEVTELLASRTEDENGNPVLIVAPSVLYPLVIAHIVEVLAAYRALPPGEAWVSELAPELVGPPHRGGDARANQILANALALPATAWDDAMDDRYSFYPEVPYHAIKSARALGLSGDALAIAQRVEDRGDALEIALGWFSHSLRLAVGGYSLTITRDRAFRL